jgi:hypothetical protein
MALPEKILDYFAAHTLLLLLHACQLMIEFKHVHTIKANIQHDWLLVIKNKLSFSARRRRRERERERSLLITFTKLFLSFANLSLALYRAQQRDFHFRGSRLRCGKEIIIKQSRADMPETIRMRREKENERERERREMVGGGVMQ